MPNLREICEGDLIAFEEKLEYQTRNKFGDLIVKREHQCRCVRARVGKGKTRSGSIRLDQCVFDSGRTQERATRKVKKLFCTFANLTLLSKGERGKLVHAEPGSMHPDAKGVYDMKSAPSHPHRQERIGSIYDGPLVRALHNDTVREHRREQAEADREVEVQSNSCLVTHTK